MKKKAWLVCGMISLFSVSGHADQAAYMNKTIANKAVSLLKSKPEIRLYCQPCGDVAWSSQRIRAVQAVNTGYDNLWEVKVNAASVDLAYVYINVTGQWQNIALLLGLPVRGVDKVLPNG